MASRYDYIQDENGDLLINGGDWVIAESDSMHIQDTIIAVAGWWKQYPTDGVGVQYYSKSAGQEQILAREIKIQLELDKYTVLNPIVSFENDKLTINPNATI
jgi:hypothetical protein